MAECAPVKEALLASGLPVFKVVAPVLLLHSRQVSDAWLSPPKDSAMPQEI